MAMIKKIMRFGAKNGSGVPSKADDRSDYSNDRSVSSQKFALFRILSKAPPPPHIVTETPLQPNIQQLQ